MYVCTLTYNIDANISALHFRYHYTVITILPCTVVVRPADNTDTIKYRYCYVSVHMYM